MHGHSGKASPEYRSWRSMRGRCLNTNDPAYRNYGGRGISICSRWNKFENFYTDMGARPKGTSLDRIDNNGNYEPDNCRWATHREQSLNTRLVNYITINGETKCLYDWCRQYGLDPGTVRYRMRVFGWAPEKAVTTPKMRSRRSVFDQGGKSDAVERGVCP